ncbi:MAG: AMP-binding protein [Planctomycetaceae bacterium]|nr:AMP-binding protein [Planctomycetaceae bacterium]
MTDRITSRADYDRLLESFAWECPDEFNFGFDVVDRWADSRPEATALFSVTPDGERTITFAELRERTNRVAHALTNLGLKPGDRVLVMLPRIVEWWETMVGLLKGGLVAMPGTTLLTPKDIAYRIWTADVTAVITDAEGAAKADAITDELPTLRERIIVGDDSGDSWHPYTQIVDAASFEFERTVTRADDPAIMYFTSGTTGHPKMVLHTQASYGIGHTTTGRYWLDLHPDDLHWNVSDTGWAKAAWSSLFGPWIQGAGLFVQHSPGRFDPGDVIRMLNKFPITTMCAAPTIFRLLVQEDLSQLKPKVLRHCVAAGEPLNPEVISTWKKATGITIRDGYGQTETVLLCGNFPGIEVKPGSMGLPAPGIDLAIVDESGSRLPPGRDGHIAVAVEPQRPLGLFQEYWRNDDANAESFHDGWYFTGDCGRTDEDGYFWFEGRADDVISSSAYRIGPFEVESALLEHPLVVEAAVVGKPDETRGQIVKAFVVLNEPDKAGNDLIRDLQDHVKQTTAPYKYPREIEFVADLPKTVSGKIRRVELREQSQ